MERRTCSPLSDRYRATAYAARMNLLEDPGRFYWKWIVTGAVLLVVYAIERAIRTGSLF